MCAFEVQSGEWFQSVPTTLRTVTDTFTCSAPPQKVRNLCLSTDLRQSGSISPSVLLSPRISSWKHAPPRTDPPPFSPFEVVCVSAQSLQSCPPPGDLADPEIKPGSPALQADSLLLSHWRNPFEGFGGAGVRGEVCQKTL